MKNIIILLFILIILGGDYLFVESENIEISKKVNTLHDINITTNNSGETIKILVSKIEKQTGERIYIDKRIANQTIEIRIQEKLTIDEIIYKILNKINFKKVKNSFSRNNITRGINPEGFYTIIIRDAKDIKSGLYWNFFQEMKKRKTSN